MTKQTYTVFTIENYDTGLLICDIKDGGSL